MDREDKRRYFLNGSVYLEVVTPLFQQKLEEHYTSLNFRSLKDFLDTKAVIHILFHLRHRNAWCCTDKANCTNQGSLPLNHHQWKQLYAENPGPGIHNCFCKYTAKSINLVDLDVSLCGLILYNCCNLGQLDQDAVHILRRNKNDYLSHNTTCGITKDEYGPLMDELKTNILQLDQTKEDELIRIQKRPLDDALCNRYVTDLLDNHEMLERELWQTLSSFIYLRFQNGRENLDEQEIEEQPIETIKLGQPIFALHHTIDLTSEIGDDFSRVVPAAVMMDDGRIVICLPDLHKLLICNTDGSNIDRIHAQEGPWAITAVNDTTVAVLMLIMRIEIYDINTKHNLKSISVPGMWLGTGITTINNKLVVYAERRLQIIDHQSDKVVQTIDTECGPYRLHGFGDRIFYYNNDNDFNNKLYWYNNTHEQHGTVKLPSQPMCMTTLQDGSLYVVCKDGSVRHVSRDCQQYETVTTEGLKGLKYHWMLYNKKQRKLVTKELWQTLSSFIYLRFQNGRENLDEQETEEQPIETIELGQPIFALHHTIDLTSEIGDDFSRVVPAAVMMDDGRIVICLPDLHKLLICNTDGSNIDRIHAQEGPWAITAVNDTTVAVLMLIMRIEIYDINTKHNLKSILVPGMWLGTGITTINNKLVVYAERRLKIIDHQSDKVVQTIDTACGPYRLHGFGDRIFYYNNDNDFNNKLYWYNNTHKQHGTVKLPSQPMCMTTLQDGSLYVVCKDGSVRHVSRDCQQYETVTTEGLKELKYHWMLYNKQQRKLVTKGDQKTIFNVFYEI